MFDISHYELTLIKTNLKQSTYNTVAFFVLYGYKDINKMT